MLLEELLIPGQKVKISFGKGNINNKTVHVRAIVDDRIVVYTVWDKYRQDWRYNYFGIDYLALLHEKGNLKRG